MPFRKSLVPAFQTGRSRQAIGGSANSRTRITTVRAQERMEGVMQFKMINAGDDRDSMLYRVDEQHLDLALRYRIQLIRCEPTTRIRIPHLSSTHADGDGKLHDDGGAVYNLAAWADWEWNAFRDNL